MTNQVFSSAYFEQARSIYQEVLSHNRAKEWHLVVRRSQETVELLLKGLLRLAGLEVPRIHDVGNVFEREKQKLPKNIVKELDRIISISRRLRLERETSFYGDEDLELPPSSLYTQIDAQQAQQDLEWLMQFIPQREK